MDEKSKLLSRFHIDKVEEKYIEEYYWHRGVRVIGIYRKKQYTGWSKIKVMFCSRDLNGELEAKSFDHAMQFVEYASKFKYKKPGIKNGY